MSSNQQLKSLNKLTCVTYIVLTLRWAEFVKSLSQLCDFLLLQQHGLYRSQFVLIAWVIIVEKVILISLKQLHNCKLPGIDGNWRHLRFKYGMEEYNIIKSWDAKCKNECETLSM